MWEKVKKVLAWIGWPIAVVFGVILFGKNADWLLSKFRPNGGIDEHLNRVRGNLQELELIIDRIEEQSRQFEYKLKQLEQQNVDVIARNDLIKSAVIDITTTAEGLGARVTDIRVDLDRVAELAKSTTAGGDTIKGLAERLELNNERLRNFIQKYANMLNN